MTRATVVRTVLLIAPLVSWACASESPAAPGAIPAENALPGSVRINASWQVQPLPSVVRNRCPAIASSALDVNQAGNIVGWIILQCPESYAEDVPIMWWGPGHRIILPTIPAGLTAIDASAINGRNQMAGTEYDYQYHPIGAIFWPTPTIFFERRAYMIRALDVDDAGNVVGFYQASASIPVSAFSWNPLAGSFTLLPTLGGLESEALAVSSLGTVAGWAQDSVGLRHAVLWDQGKKMVDLGLLPGGTFAEVLGISDNQKFFVGHADDANYQTQGVYFSPGAQPSLLFANDPTDVNGSNQVVGSDNADAFVKDPTLVGIIRLARLPGSRSAIAFGINDQSVIVGLSADSEAHAVIWQ